MSHPEKPRTSPPASERIYEKLLATCPKEFREDHGPQMIQSFGDLRREERYRGRLGHMRLWSRTLPDLALTAVSERSKMMGQTMIRAGRLATLGNLMILNGAVLLMVGLAFATQMNLVELYGADLSWNVDNENREYAVFGFVRLLGFTCLGYGLLLLVTSRVAEMEVRKPLAGVLASINTFSAVYLLGAQLEMWETTTGWITIAILSFFALGYGFFWTTNAGLTRAYSSTKQVR